MLTVKDINEHPMLDDDQRLMCRTMLTASKKRRQEFNLLDFVAIALRATGNDYAAVTDSDNVAARVKADRAHQKAALLYTYEALKASDEPYIKEYPHLDDALGLIAWLAENLP